jgi:hypothetical protein
MALIVLSSFSVLVFAQDPIPIPEKALPHLGIQLLRSDVADLLKQGDLDKVQANKLNLYLSGAERHLWEANQKDSIDSMDDFIDKTSDLIESKKLSVESGLPLLNLSTSIQQAIIALIGDARPPPWPEVFCPHEPPGPPPGGILSLHVAADAAGGGDGTPGDPFNSISAALAHATAMGLAAVELMLAVGRYEEHIEITLHTRISGAGGGFLIPIIAGSIAKSGPYALQIHNLAITDSGSGPPGAIFVHNSCASTFLSNVFALNAVGFGIFQRGGVLNAHDLTIDNTFPVASTTGVAMQLDGGVSAYLQDVRVSRSHGGGFLIQHMGTQVFATGLDVMDTEMNPFAEEDARFDPNVNPGTVAIDIRDGAILTGHWVRVRVNEFVGLYVHSGAEADLLYSQVRDTRALDRLDFSAGFNVAVGTNGRLEMTGFSLRQADLCGIALLSGGADADLHHGEIAEAPIGACVQIPGYDTSRLRDDVDYIDVGIPLQATSYETPEPVTGH